MAHDVHERSGSSRDEPPPTRPAPVHPGVEVEYHGNRPTVSVRGRVDRRKVTEVSGTIRGLLAVGVRELVVDLTDAWDGAALLPVLARTRTELLERGGSLSLVGVALPEFLAALSTASLDEVFLVYEAVHQQTARRVPGTGAS